MDIEEPTWSNYQPSFEHAGLLARPLQLPHPTLWTSGCTSRIADEAQNQWFLMAHATKLVPFRVNTDMLSVMFVTQLVLSNDEHLLVGEGVAASPFVNAGIKTRPRILEHGHDMWYPSDFCRVNLSCIGNFANNVSQELYPRGFCQGQQQRTPSMGP